MNQKPNLKVSHGYALRYIAICFALFLFAEGAITQAPSKRNQDAAVKFSVLPQPDSPILLGIEYVDQSMDLRRFLKFELKNVAVKPIRSATVLISDGHRRIYSSTGFLESLESGGLSGGGAFLDEMDLSGTYNATLTVDFVLFTDGSYWGDNKAGDSDINHGYESGLRMAVFDVRAEMKVGNTAELLRFLSRQITESNINERLVNANTKFKKGYRFGYAATLGKFRIAFLRRDRHALDEKLAEIEQTFG